MVDDTQLDQLTVKQLHALKDAIEVAIRAQIRAKRSPQAATAAVAASPPKMDIERERDAWLSARR